MSDPRGDPAMWSCDVIPQCDLAIWSRDMVPQCDPAIWFRDVISQCNSALWFHDVIPQWGDLRSPGQIRVNHTNQKSRNEHINGWLGINCLSIGVNLNMSQVYYFLPKQGAQRNSFPIPNTSPFISIHYHSIAFIWRFIVAHQHSTHRPIAPRLSPLTIQPHPPFLTTLLPILSFPFSSQYRDIRKRHDMMGCPLPTFLFVLLMFWGASYTRPVYLAQLPIQCNQSQFINLSPLPLPFPPSLLSLVSLHISYFNVWLAVWKMVQHVLFSESTE